MNAIMPPAPHDGGLVSHPGPDLGTAMRHVALLTGAADNPVHIRCLHDSDREAPAGLFYGAVSECWPDVEAAQQAGYGVFLVVNEGGNTDADITSTRALFVDADGRPLPNEWEWHTEPGFIVRRDDDHWHAYWCVEGLAVAEFKPCQRRLAAHYGTDASVSNPSRVMRLAGTLHLKDPTAPKRITLEILRDPGEPRTRSVGELMAGVADSPAQEKPPEPSSASAASGEPITPGMLRTMLAHIEPTFDGGSGTWVGLAKAVRHGQLPLTETRDEAWWTDLADDWCSGELWRTRTGEPSFSVPTYQGRDELLARIGDRPRVNGAAITLGTIVTLANDGGYRGPIDAKPASETFAQHVARYVNPTKPKPAPKQGEIVSAPQNSELFLAQGFAIVCGRELRFVAEWNKWMFFDGRRWREETTPAVWNCVGKMVSDQAQKLDAAAAKKLCTRATIAAVEALARGQDGILTPADHWDTDPFALNTPGGIVNLRTGELHPSDPGAHCTKITAVAPGGGCPLWRAFLDRITDGDPELIAYLQRLAGYALTGSTKEHVLAFMFGTGRNGKGVFLNTLTATMGDYAKVAPVDTFTQSQNDRHPTDMAMLCGARLVAAQETEQGKAWAEAKIKALTGGDPVTARFMHRDFFTYTPQFHKPRLHNVDEAIRRRLHMVPFKVTIPEAECDPDLPEKLKAEWPGILAWAIEGCVEWQKQGLRPPSAVQEMTREYLTSQDPLAEWLGSVRPAGRTWWSSKQLYESFTQYAAAVGEMPMDKKQFVERLISHGFELKEQGHAKTRGYVWPKPPKVEEDEL